MQRRKKLASKLFFSQNKGWGKGKKKRKMEERTLCKRFLPLFSGAAAAACNCQLSLINSYILRGQERKFFVTDSNKSIIHLIIRKHTRLYLKSLPSCIHSRSHTQTGRSSYSSVQGHNPNEHHSTAQ